MGLPPSEPGSVTIKSTREIELENRVQELEAGLEEIANLDYRGNRPEASQIAERVLRRKR